MVTDTRSAHWAEHLCNPVPLAAVLVLAVNDHVLKRAGVLPPTVTGKLSDFAGLFFFPLLISALIRLGRRLAGRGADDNSLISGFSITSTAAVFAGIKVSPTFNAFIASVWGSNSLDATDLWALLALIPSWFWMRRPHGSHPEILQFGAVATAGLASLATSGPVYRRDYPRWTVASQPVRELGCATAEIWFMKSGRQGAGATLQLSTRERACSVQITGAELDLNGLTVPASTLPAPILLSTDAPTEHAYVAFVFDGNETWNSGRREGTLHVALTANGGPQAWDVPVINKFSDGQYVEDPDGYEQANDGGAQSERQGRPKP